MRGLVFSICGCVMAVKCLIYCDFNVTAQDVIIGDSASTGTVTQSNGRITVGPDPNQRSQLLGILGDVQVQAALELSESQLEAISRIRNELQGDLNSLRKFSADDTEFLRDFQDARKAYQEAASLAIDELLNARQLERLKQLVYRMEISVLGYDGSLIYGRLGLASGVYENQFSHISKRTQEILAEAQVKRDSIKREAEDEILAELSPDQRKKAKEHLGPFFDYQFRSPLTKAATEMRLRSKEKNVP